MKVLITEKIPSSAKTILEGQGVEVIEFTEDRPMTREELLTMAKDCQGIISMLSNKIDKELMEACPQLKVVANYAVGFDNIDLAAARERGIKVGNTPNTLAETTAELALSLMMSVARRLPEAFANVKNGEWKRWLASGFLGRDLKGKTLGIFGMGEIGEAMAYKCARGFDMKVLYCARSPKKNAEEKLGAQKVDFDTLLQEADYISVHCPLTPETLEIFNKDAFNKMKKAPIFINTARGKVVNQVDLDEALKSGKIAGAGLDVTEPEPLSPESPLLKHANVLITPHIGSATHETRTNMAALAAQNIMAGLLGEKLPAEVK